MSNPTTVASTILGIITGKGKSDNKQQAGEGSQSFLSLIGGYEKGVVGLQSDSDLVDTLYSKDKPSDDDVQPVAAVVSAGNSTETHGVLASSVANKSSELDELPEATQKDLPPKALDRAGAPTEKSGKRRDDEAHATNKPTQDDTRSAPAKSSSETPATEQTQETEPTPAVAENNGELSLADKIHNKILELSDILSAIASLLGLSAGAAVAVVRISQTTITSTTTTNATLGNAFLDLSDRFRRLISAVESAQNLTPQQRLTLTDSLSQFQSILTAQTNVADVTALVSQAEGFLQSCAVCEESLQLTVASFATVTNTTTVAASQEPIQEALGDLSQWLKDFGALVKEAKTAASTVTTQTTTDTTIAADNALSAEAALNKAANLLTDDNVSVTKATTAQASTAQVTPTITQPVSSAANVQTAAAVEQVRSNASFTGQQQGGGQGGERPSTPVTFGATGATQSTGNNGPANFASTLKAATPQTPVNEQVLVHVKTMVKNGDSKIEIKLDPAELGKMTIKLEVSSEGKTGVHITVDSKPTLDLLQRDARGLERALAEAGLKADSGSLSFNLRGGDQGKQEQQQASLYSKQQPEEELIPLTVVSHSYTLKMADGLDIRI